MVAAKEKKKLKQQNSKRRHRIMRSLISSRIRHNTCNVTVNWWEIIAASWQQRLLKAGQLHRDLESVLHLSWWKCLTNRFASGYTCILLPAIFRHKKRERVMAVLTPLLDIFAEIRTLKVEETPTKTVFDISVLLPVYVGWRDTCGIDPISSKYKVSILLG